MGKLRGDARRVIVIALTGFEPAQVDRFADEGLLHYLPLLEDIGIRFSLSDASASDLESMASSLRREGIEVTRLTSDTTVAQLSLEQICAADRRRQEQLFDVLERQRRGVALCEFAMLAQLASRFGPHPTAEDEFVLRDVHARMDEHVGKVLSFVDERTALVVEVSRPPSACRESAEESHVEVFVTPPVRASETRSRTLREIVLQLLDSRLR